MSNFSLRGPSVALASCLVLAAGTASAATMAPITVADMTDVDELGYVCLNEGDLEAAYSAVGKKGGALLPQICMPKPCEALSPDELADLKGREPTEGEWGEYVARYAEHCIAETGTPWPEDVMFASASDPVDDFFAGLVGPPLNSGVGSDIVGPIVGPAGGVFTPGVPIAVPTRIAPIGGGGGFAGGSGGSGGGLFLPPFVFPSFSGSDSDDDVTVVNVVTPPTTTPPGGTTPGGTPPGGGFEGGGDNTLPPPSPVPLPASMLLLLGALGLTAGSRAIFAWSGGSAA